MESLVYILSILDIFNKMQTGLTSYFVVDRKIHIAKNKEWYSHRALEVVRPLGAVAYWETPQGLLTLRTS